MDHKISRGEFIKFYVGNEINPNLKSFWIPTQFGTILSKNKDEFKNIKKD